jgi:O-antigen ligase
MSIHIKFFNKNFFFLVVFFGLFSSFVIGSAFVNFFIVIASILGFYEFLRNKPLLHLINNLQIFIITFFFFTIILSSYYKSHDINDITLIRFLGLSLFCFFFKEELKKNIIKILIFLALLSILVNLDIILQFFLGANSLGWTKAQGILSTGFFGKEKISGSFISKISILCLTIMLCTEHNKKIKILTIVALILSIITIIISTERKAVFDIIFFLIIVLFIIPSKKTFAFSFLFLSIVLFATLVLPGAKTNLIQKTFFQFGINKQNNKINVENKNCQINNIENCYTYFGLSKEGSITQNLYYAHYLTAINIWKDYPIFGAGNKKFRINCSNSKYEIKNNQFSEGRCSTHPHNIYLAILAEYGIIGFLLFIILILKIIFKKNNYKKNNPNNFFLLLLIILLLPIPNGNIFSTWLGSFFWLALGFSLEKKF